MHSGLGCRGLEAHRMLTLHVQQTQVLLLLIIAATGTTLRCRTARILVALALLQRASAGLVQREGVMNAHLVPVTASWGTLVGDDNLGEVSGEVVHLHPEAAVVAAHKVQRLQQTANNRQQTTLSFE